MACDSQAGLEAQKLISISLGKMAASRVGRTGTSLHKSLLVASVLHRARHVFLEESYHVHRVGHPDACPQSPTASPSVVAVYTPLLPPPTPSETPVEGNTIIVDSPEDKENFILHEQIPPQQEPSSGGDGITLRMPLGENNNLHNTTTTTTRQTTALKRRRCVTQQETQEAVWSILPKRPRTCLALDDQNNTNNNNNSVTDLQQQQLLQHQQEEELTKEEEEEQEEEDNNENVGLDENTSSNTMEVEHITSLVSIFSFGGQRVDMCGTEAAREDVAQFQPLALAV
ncbi:hypothetical protein Pmani_007758 [Petrolisthes manimaculis]|uniref:Uncharacterized protein n=1 Tax=Petrolisthes manimaculis TaxID=1843537 RepID=A0AAE1UKF0_9EUCA|nr:hypothetical protein Pmani_007758 [Petrolisthes manimaculis]